MNRTIRRKSISISFFIMLVLSIELTSCLSSRNTSPIPGLKGSNCYIQEDYHYSAADIPTSIQDVQIDTLLTKTFSFEALNVASAIGILDLLTRYADLRREYIGTPSSEKRIALLELHQVIIGKLNISSLEISSVTSELDCEEERADQIANYLKNKLDQREKNLVIGSIVVGATGTITSEALNNSASAGKSGSYVAIGASLVEAALGVLMLTNQNKISFMHYRNTPGEIWNAPVTSKTLPPSIWYYLNYKDGDRKKVSLRELLVQNWMAFGQVRSTKKNARVKGTSDIYFGNGGRYSAEELKNRADMYDQTEAYINLMKQDLKLLSMEFEDFATTK